ncbi:LacI family DNA-binding transcriptional regulator [Lactiplantibacillus modestisalitolerans]|uniref:LacI family DNA-binding transcriptional regulator n=1 Tax=Lactiplantibacillus modestisalitolerans TaxID=1457219 RepID=A0ABV5WRF7_9LACO|nr:LacI family DNA-binding transcriptional regulator [Lactiplantibacillus modestisalitolerans]
MASISSIAKLAGVSKATVSRILNDDQSFSVSATTKKRVLEVAEKLNYKLTSPSGKGNVNNLHIAIVNCLRAEDELGDPYFRMIKNGIEERVKDWGMHVVSEVRPNDKDRNWQRFAALGAVIVLGTVAPDVLDEIYAYNQNIVVVNDARHFPKCDVIQNDFGPQTERVLDMMKAKGHRKIAFIGGRMALMDKNGLNEDSLVDVRETAYLDWMKRNGLADEISDHTTGWTSEDALVVMQELLKKERPTAVLVGSDPQAVGVYRAIQEAGLTIPNDIAVASFDDINMVSFLYPALTTVRPAAKEIGRQAVNLLRERVFGGRTASVGVTVNSELIVRESL